MYSHVSTPTHVTRAEPDATAARLKNWGKWGPDDQVGTLNYTTAEDIVRAAAGEAIAKLRARLAIQPESSSRRILSEAFDESSRAFMGALQALQALLPELPAPDLGWRFHFLLGAMVYTMANPGRIQSLTGGLCDPGGTEAALRHLVPFIAAGFRSPPIAKPARRSRRKTNA